jgi:hypothetical protein
MRKAASEAAQSNDEKERPDEVNPPTATAVGGILV